MTAPTAVMKDLSLADGRYSASRVLGHGGMATVYLGEDEALGRPVAIKLLAENLAADEDFRRRFMLEARHAAKLSHPNVIQVFDVGEWEGRPYIVMEYAPGETLAQLLKRRSLNELEAVELALQACAGLGEAHEAGIVHRDVKPQNLLVGEDRKLKVTDFGIARAVEDTRVTATGSVIGSRPYLSPERERGEPAGPAADVYALGVVMSEMVKGKGGEGLASVIARCCMKSPSRRYPSAVQLGQALQDLSPSESSEAATRKLRPPTRGFDWDSTLRRFGPKLALAAVLLVGAVVLLTSGPADNPPTAGSAPSKPAAKPSQPKTLSGPDSSGTPADQARALAEWLRQQSP